MEKSSNDTWKYGFNGKCTNNFVPIGSSKLQVHRLHVEYKPQKIRKPKYQNSNKQQISFPSDSGPKNLYEKFISSKHSANLVENVSLVCS